MESGGRLERGSPLPCLHSKPKTCQAESGPDLASTNWVNFKCWMYTFGKLAPISSHKRKNALMEKNTVLSECSFSRRTKEAVALPLVPANAPCTPTSSGGITATKLHSPHHPAGRPRLAASCVNMYPHVCWEVQFLNLCERYTNGVPFRYEENIHVFKDKSTYCCSLYLGLRHKFLMQQIYGTSEPHCIK